GVRRPQGSACDIGAFEVAIPTIKIASPFRRGSYERGLRVSARFRCSEGGISGPIATCKGTAANGHAINTHSTGAKSFKVIAIDKTGRKLVETVHYTVWGYTNPLRSLGSIVPRRIDMGVDYGGSGPIRAIGKGKVTMASNSDSGPSSCWGVSCWPGGGIVVYRL